MSLPRWLTESGEETPPIDGRGFSAPKERFIHKTIRHAVSFTQDALFNTDVSSRNGFLQRVEPRLKTAGIVLFIILVSLQKTPQGIAAFTAAAAVLALVSRIPPWRLMKRLLPVAAFTSAIAAPSVLNLIVDGDALITLFSFDSPLKLGPLTVPKEITITHEGTLSALTLVLRAVTSVLAVFVLTMTTAPEKLIRSVSFFLPGTLGTVLSVSYRYIYFLLLRLREFVTAYRARSTGGCGPQRGGTAGEGARWAASRTSSLFAISLRMSRSLQTAMEARGYSFDAARTAAPDARPLGLYDLLWAAFLAAAIIWSLLR